MEFQVGEQVVHPVYGVGTVKALSDQQFSGTTTRHYYEVITHGPTVWVPIDEQGHTVLRRIASKASIARCRDLLQGSPIPFDKKHQVRQLEIAARLKGGLLPALCEMIRDLRARSWGIPLGVTEEVLLRRISKVVCDEWAASDGISPLSALGEIEDLLKTGSQAWVPGAGARKPSRRNLSGW